MSERKPNARNSGTILALFALLAAFAGMIGLTAMVLPAALGFVAVIFGMFSFGVLHYLLWGWWLGKPRQPDEDA